MSVRSLIEKLPYIAECKDADRFSKRNLMMFDYEIENPESVFSYRESDSINDRLAAMEIPTRCIGRMDLYIEGVIRIRLAMLAHDHRKGRITKDRESVLKEFIMENEDINVYSGLIDNELTKEMATRDVWA